MKPWSRRIQIGNPLSNCRRYAGYREETLDNNCTTGVNHCSLSPRRGYTTINRFPRYEMSLGRLIGCSLRLSSDPPPPPTIPGGHSHQLRACEESRRSQMSLIEVNSWCRWWQVFFPREFFERLRFHPTTVWERSDLTHRKVFMDVRVIQKLSIVESKETTRSFFLPSQSFFTALLLLLIITSCAHYLFPIQ